MLSSCLGLGESGFVSNYLRQSWQLHSLSLAITEPLCCVVAGAPYRMSAYSLSGPYGTLIKAPLRARGLSSQWLMLPRFQTGHCLTCGFQQAHVVATWTL